MYGWNDLKHRIAPRLDGKVECPVSGCLNLVDRQTGRDLKTEKRFHCSDHHIYISPSTFEYDLEEGNILWDYDLLQEHKEVKRETRRMARDNSEDAVTWNVFRYLENSGLLGDYLAFITKCPQTNPETMFWSYRKQDKRDWDLLNKARREFGETIKRGSEPDLMVFTDQSLFFIEAKLTASNKIAPKERDDKYHKKYDTGADGWFSKVFKPSEEFWDLAATRKQYELLRFWLLGTWMSNDLKKGFYLLNLVREDAEKTIETDFGMRLVQGSCKFKRITWEDIYRFANGSSTNKDRFARYMEGKTIGYRQGILNKAFSI